MTIKVDGVIKEVASVCYDQEDKGTYYYVVGEKTPYCDLDYDIKIVNAVYVRTSSSRISKKKDYDRYSIVCGDVLIGAIVQMADTIEELIDGFIVEQKDKTDVWFVMSPSEFVETPLDDRLYSGKSWNYHAFIKDKYGLHYVAIMNDKGELKLL